MKPYIQAWKPLILLCIFLSVAKFMNGIMIAASHDSDSALYGYSLAFY
jgi:zinc transporter ZupT